MSGPPAFEPVKICDLRAGDQVRLPERYRGNFDYVSDTFPVIGNGEVLPGGRAQVRIYNPNIDADLTLTGRDDDILYTLRAAPQHREQVQLQGLQPGDEILLDDERRRGPWEVQSTFSTNPGMTSAELLDVWGQPEVYTAPSRSLVTRTERGIR